MTLQARSTVAVPVFAGMGGLTCHAATWFWAAKEAQALGLSATSQRIELLLDWHEQYPPDTYERHRNAAIFELQGNRNPLIDHPEWTSKIENVRYEQQLENSSA